MTYSITKNKIACLLVQSIKIFFRGFEIVRDSSKRNAFFLLNGDVDDYPSIYGIEMVNAPYKMMKGGVL